MPVFLFLRGSVRCLLCHGWVTLSYPFRSAPECAHLLLKTNLLLLGVMICHSNFARRSWVFLSYLSLLTRESALSFPVPLRIRLTSVRLLREQVVVQLALT